MMTTQSGSLESRCSELPNDKLVVPLGLVYKAPNHIVVESDS